MTKGKLIPTEKSLKSKSLLDGDLGALLRLVGQPLNPFVEHFPHRLEEFDSGVFQMPSNGGCDSKTLPDGRQDFGAWAALVDNLFARGCLARL
jgi:hypothetical protein